MEKKFLKESKILWAVNRLSQKLEVEVYLVGGAVRDFFLQKPLGNDFDFVVKERIEELAKELARVISGHAFLLDQDFGTWRVVKKTGDKKIDLDFSPLQGENIQADLKQRDFTINSMALLLQEIFSNKTPSLLDPLNGISDLQKKILRANSEVSLRRDPLRMLRAFRFAYTLGFKVEDDTLKMIQRNKKLILQSARERIRNEFFAGLNEGQADGFFQDLRQSGLLEEIFPEVKEAEGLANALRLVKGGEVLFAHLEELFPACSGSLMQHFSRMIEDGVTRKALWKFIAFFGDLSPGNDEAAYEGIDLAIAQRMNLSRKAIRIITGLTRQNRYIRDLFQIKEWKSRVKARFFLDLEEEGVEVIFRAMAQALASPEINLLWPGHSSEDFERMKGVAGELLSYYYGEFSLKPPNPLLDGREIIEALGILPGKEVGNLLVRLREAELTGLIGTREEALEFLKNIDRSSQCS